MAMRGNGYPVFLGHRNIPRIRGQQSDIPSQQATNPLPFANEFQPDIEQMAATRKAIAAHPIDSMGGWKGSDDERVPKVRMANKSARILAANVPQLLIRMNPSRSLFVVSNQTGAVMQYSYGYPNFPGSGCSLTANATLTISGLACPIDDIYVMSPNVGAIVSGFEGVPGYTPPPAKRHNGNIGHNSRQRYTR